MATAAGRGRLSGRRLGDLRPFACCLVIVVPDLVPLLALQGNGFVAVTATGGPGHVRVMNETGGCGYLPADFDYSAVNDRLCGDAYVPSEYRSQGVDCQMNVNW